MAQTVGTGAKSLPEQAVEIICRYIKENGLVVGDKLPNEFQLAELCGVGRSTIREAIKLLTFAGCVEVIRGSGTYITKQHEAAGDADDDPLNLQDSSSKNVAKTALQYFDVRMMLEPEVAAMAASNATYADCQKLLAAQREVEACVEKGEDHLQADMRFHAQIAVCTHNDVVNSLMEIVMKGIPVFIELTRNVYANITLEYHRQITESIANGDPLGARCAMIAHLNSNRMKILKTIEEEKR